MAKVDYGTLPPLPTRNPAGRLSATRFGRVLDYTARDIVLLQANGFAPPGTPLPGYPRLVLEQSALQLPDEEDSSPRLIENYVEAGDDFEMEQPPESITGPDGLGGWRLSLIAKAGTDTSGFLVGAMTHDGMDLSEVTVAESPSVTRVVATFGGAGLLAEATDPSANGKLVRISKTSRNAVPTAPAGSGWALVSDRTESPLGFPTYSRVWVKGEGVISRQPGERNNGKLLTVSIRALSAPDGSNPITPEPTYYALPASYQEADGHRVWSQDFVKGEGVIDTAIRQEEGGLRTVQWVSLGTKQTPTPGIVVVERSREADGYMIHEVTVLQNSEGGDPTAGLNQAYIDRVPFRYPGRAKASKINVGTGTQPVGSGTWWVIDALLSPPIDVAVEAEVEERLSADSRLSDPEPYWMPVEWASSCSKYWPAGGAGPVMDIQGLPGYRTDGPTQNLVSGVVGTQGTHGNLGSPSWVRADNAGALSSTDITFVEHVGAGGPNLVCWVKCPLFTTTQVPTLRVNIGPKGSVWPNGTVATGCSLVVTPNGSGNYKSDSGGFSWVRVTLSWALILAGVYSKTRLRNGVPTMSVDFYTITAGGSSVNEQRNISQGVSVNGRPISLSSTGYLTILGGPPAPDGNRWTLRNQSRPAYTGVDGTVYYRHTFVVATIPPQPPVPDYTFP